PPGGLIWPREAPVTQSVTSACTPWLLPRPGSQTTNGDACGLELAGSCRPAGTQPSGDGPARCWVVDGLPKWPPGSTAATATTAPAVSIAAAPPVTAANLIRRRRIRRRIASAGGAAVALNWSE